MNLFLLKKPIDLFKSLTIYGIVFSNCISYAQTFEIENKNSNLFLSKKLAAPKRVYRATPTDADFIFLLGFERQMCDREFNSRERCLDLTNHLLLNLNRPELSVTETATSQLQNPSAFISTSANKDYVIENARRSALLDIFNEESPWRRNYFYVYEIIPNEDFVSVTETYQRELNSAFDDPIRFHQLDNLYSLYTNTNEFAAIGRISTRNIVSATRYEFDLEIMDFIEGITIPNPHYDTNLVPAVHLNNYPIGEISNALQNSDEMHCEIEIRPLQNHLSMRYKRDLNKKYECKKPYFLEEEIIDSPKKIFENNKLKIKIKESNKNEKCLVHNDHYLYTDSCDNSTSNEFIYTQFGQIISRSNGDENNQYFCLSKSEYENDYLKMEICDLNKIEQIWKIKKFSDSSFALYTYKGTGVGLYYYLGTPYLFEKKNNDQYPIVIISNYHEIEEKISKPIIQFSIEATIKGLGKKENYTIYPSVYGSVKADSLVNLKEYINYYNANLNLLFSNFGMRTISPLVCYYSYIGNYGSYTLNINKIGNDYCSNIKNINDHFKWYFNKNKENNLYEIIDTNNNKLVTSLDMINYHAYVSNKNFKINKNYYQNFNLNKAAKVYADNYYKAQHLSKVKKYNDNQFFNKFAFYSIYDYYRKIYSDYK
ncbi:hypothetical protein GCL60_06315 [Silvanigrella paludirubra]|uniref:Uncharacterized protein n=1 Tax=Silvanigrella paludirubra TaxID=2499159 RepID=A0A6N6VVI5_9BACT|nr:hypothetical protein [Silvanigrella paludirubra]KAB8039874.1 hypothetical protein GCL60_06315 [Silvanigrella paludirubra]